MPKIKPFRDYDPNEPIQRFDYTGLPFLPNPNMIFIYNHFKIQPSDLGAIGNSMQEFKNYQPPSWEEYFMRHVYLAASKSKDPSTKIGAVIVMDKRVISEGYNGLCRGCKEKPERNERPAKYSYYEHGERNSIYNAACLGISTMGATMYTNYDPCCDCARAIIQSGITKVVVHKQWGDLEKQIRGSNNFWAGHGEITKEMFKESGVQIQVFDGELNIKAYLDGKEIWV